MKYKFDEVINRNGTNATSVSGYHNYLFDRETKLNNPYDDYIRMWVADMEFAIAPEIIQAIKDRLDKRILGYSQIFDPNYKTAFNQWCRSRYDYEFNPDHMVASDGVIPAFYDITKYVCGDDNGKMLITTPSYGFFKHAADFHNVELVKSALVYEDGIFKIDFDDFKKKAADPKVKLCLFCSPHNPTGRIWTDDELKQVARICFENDVVIISDEIHCDLLRKGKQFTPMAKLFPTSDQIITCMATSKTFNLAGIKMATTIIPNADIMAQWKTKTFANENPLSIAAAQAAWQHGGEWLAQLKDYLDANFKYLDNYLKNHLPQANFSIPDATYLAWIDVGAYFTEEENLTLFFANKAGVLLEGGNMFVDNADGYIRLNLACPRSELKEGLDRIAKAINI